MSTHLDGVDGSPKRAEVFAWLDGALGFRGDAVDARRRRAAELRDAGPTDRASAEALLRLIEDPAPVGHRWEGFCPPGSNDDVARHAAYLARRFERERNGKKRSREDSSSSGTYPESGSGCGSIS